MNKAITDGIVLMPPGFAGGLDVWSSGDGTPGSTTYDGSGYAAFVPADQDFGGCIEILKSEAIQKLRYTGETPLLPGCYLQIRARVKVISGALPSVRIAAWAGGAGGVHVPAVVQTGPAVPLSTYGKVVEVSAIVGSGARTGVDMVWGTQPLYGHFGLDLTGPNGGVVRIDDIEITDVTSVFLRDMLGLVDVRDYGAVGDGVTDDSAAFEAADAAANGRAVLVSKGTYFLGDSVTFESSVRFQGTVSMAADKLFVLTRNFDLPTYIDAFGDEELAFRKAFQALLNNADHESLDLGGRKINVTAPIDMQAAVPNRTSYATRRVIRNGQFEAAPGAAWDTETVTSQATYTPTDPRVLTGVVDVANVPVGALVEGFGVGREVYVLDKNVATQEVMLNAPLYDAAGTQVFTFKRFKYLLDFSGFSQLSKFTLSDIEFQCNNRCSAVMLAPSGLIFQVRDCFFSRPKDRGITSTGGGCQGMKIDRCQFLSSEDALDVSDRMSIALNTNANDIKLRDCRATKFRHFAVIAGSNSLILGNHFFQGDSVPNGVRTAGLVIANTHCSSIVSGNYIDNCFIEWTNEQDAAPEFNTEFSFSALSISDNIFLSGDVAPWFSYIVVKPHGAGHFLSGVAITGNRFRTINGTIDRAERVDTSFADLDYSRMKNITFSANSFHSVSRQVSNPLRIKHAQVTEAQTWVVDPDGQLPFGAWVRTVDSVVADGKIRNAAGEQQFVMPYTTAQNGTNADQVHLKWPQAVRGDATVTVRIDN